MMVHRMECPKCGFEIDYLRKTSGTIKLDCPECGSPQLDWQGTIGVVGSITEEGDD